MPSANTRVVKGDTAPPVADTGLPAGGGVVTRAVSAIVVIPPVLAAIHFGGITYDLLIGACSIVLVWEWLRLCGTRPVTPRGVAALGAATATIAVGAIAGLSDGMLVAGAGIVFVLAWTTATRDAPWVPFGILYVALPALLLLWLRDEVGRNTVYWLFAVVWATDIGAYAFGRAIGGPKLVPRVSPKKTWAGLIGGALSAAIVGALFSLAFRGGPFWPLAATSAVLAVVSQAGDLLESWVKRRFGVKDAGNIMPGHGGLLDRVDGLLAAAVALAAAAMLDGNRVLVWL